MSTMMSRKAGSTKGETTRRQVGALLRKTRPLVTEKSRTQFVAAMADALEDILRTERRRAV